MEENKENEILQDEATEVEPIDNSLEVVEEVQNESINQIITAFKAQEDEIKGKLRNQISSKDTIKKETDLPIGMDANNSSQTSLKESVGEFNADTPNQNNGNFSISGDSSKLNTNSLDNNEVEDIYIEDLVTIVERTGEHNFVLKHVDRASLSELTEDKDYSVLVEWSNLIPNDAKIEDVDTIFEKGLKDLSVNLMDKKDLLFGTLEIKKDEWVENLQENKKEYKTKSELEENKTNVLKEQVEMFGGSELVISDILSQRDSLLNTNETIEMEEDFITSTIEEDLEGLGEFFGLDEEENISTLNTLDNDNIDIMSLVELDGKTTEELIEIKEKINEKKAVLNEQRFESSEKAREYNDKAEEIDRILKGHALRNDGSLYIGEDFFNNYSIEQRGEILKEFTFTAFDEFTKQAVKQIEENTQIKEELIETIDNVPEEEPKQEQSNIINLNYNR